MKAQKQILIVDDHAIISTGLGYIFDLNFRDCATTEVFTLKDGLKQLSNGTFTHLILDLHLTDGFSLDQIPKIIKDNPLLHILVYSMASEAVYGRKLLEMNTSGFLSKASSEAEVVQALSIFLQGGIYKSKYFRAMLSESDYKTGENIFHKLSTSEHQVLNLILKGKRTKEISSEMNITSQTTATFKSRIFKKLGTENLFEIKKLAELHEINF